MRIEAEMRKHGCTLVSVHEPYLDTSTPVGVGIFAIIAGLAQQESDTKSMFITNTKAVHSKAGGHVSGIAPYGFDGQRIQRDGLTLTQLVPNEDEAEEVREMVQEVLDGKTTSAITRRLNEEGVPTKFANLGDKVKGRVALTKSRSARPNVGIKWHTSGVIKILRDPRLAGFAMTVEGRKVANKETGQRGSDGKRVPLRDANGEPIAAHEGIITPAEWFRLQSIMDGNVSTYVPSKGDPTLLGGWGLLRCAGCDGPLYPQRTGNRYKCIVDTGVIAGHSRMCINTDTADDIVARRVWARLFTLDTDNPVDLELMAEAARRFALQRDTSGIAEERAATLDALKHTQEAMRTLYRDRADGVYTGSVGSEMFKETLGRLQDQERRCGGRLAALTTQSEAATRLPVEWLEAEQHGGDPIGEGTPWAAWSVMERREFLALFVERVTVSPSVGRGRNAKTDERVTIEWARHE